MLRIDYVRVSYNTSRSTVTSMVPDLRLPSACLMRACHFGLDQPICIISAVSVSAEKIFQRLAEGYKMENQ